MRQKLQRPFRTEPEVSLEFVSAPGVRICAMFMGNLT
jgi:hypothetical protein